MMCEWVFGILYFNQHLAVMPECLEIMQPFPLRLQT